MKIWIITSGNENLILMKILRYFDVEVIVWYDSLFWPYQDKTFDIILQRVQKWIDFLKTKKVDKIILHPIFELYFYNQNKFVDLILPLFQNYVLDFCFKYSLIGKIWIAGWFVDKKFWQKFLENLQQKYSLTENQQNIKKFHFPFAFWFKQVDLRNYFLNLHSPRQNMVNKFVKLDCRYFKDAKVDTLIPLEYSYFWFERWFKHTFFTKKTRFHWLSSLEQSFMSVTNLNKLPQRVNKKYEIYFTDSEHLFYTQKKRQYLFGKNNFVISKI